MFPGYFKAISNMPFKKGTDGNTLFYPFGIFGKGYILPNEKIERKIRKSFMVFNIISLLIAIPVFRSNLSIEWVLLFFALSFTWFYIKIYRPISSCSESSERLTFKETLTTYIAALNPFLIGFIHIGSWGFVLMALYIIIVQPISSDGFMVALLGGGFFSLSLMMSGYMLLMKIREHKH